LNGYYGDTYHAGCKVDYASYALTAASVQNNGTSTFSNTGNGYLLFQNGFKIMWGTLTTVGNNAYTVSYPTSFSSYSRVVCSGSGSGGNPQDNAAEVTGSSTSSFTLYDAYDSSHTTFWIAVGY
jgi:hypothetical protein